jgi:plasmid maintenance system antidote protein VapI
LLGVSATGDRDGVVLRQVRHGCVKRYWINMQTDYDIETEHDLHEEELRRVEVLVSPGAA